MTIKEKLFIEKFQRDLSEIQEDQKAGVAWNNIYAKLLKLCLLTAKIMFIVENSND